MAFVRFIWLMFAFKKNADSNSSLQKWAYDLRVPTTTLNCAIIVSHKPYLLVKWSYLLRVHLRVRFRLTTFSETVPSSLKERKKNKFWISKYVIFTHFRRSFGTSYPYLPEVTKIKSQLDMIFSRFPSINKLFIFSQQSKQLIVEK